MASPDLISSVSSALNHLDLSGGGLLNHTRDAVLQLKIELRSVKLQLVICFRKLGDDLPPRFSGIEGVIARILHLEIPPSYESSVNTFEPWIHREAVPELRGFAKQLADECCTSPLAVDDVVAIADSILENVADFRALVGLSCKVDVIDNFVEQVTFLKGLLAFSTGTGAELQHLMIHFQPFAITVARVFVGNQPRLIPNSLEELHLKCSAVIGIATDPQVYEAYTQALSISTFSSAPAAGVLENFLDSLVSLMWNVLRSIVDSRTKDQLKVLYGRLRFCRSILNRKPRGCDGEMRDGIGVLLCGAGMLVCSLHHTHVELSYPDRLSELLEKFNHLQAQFENNASESTAPTTPNASEYILEDSMMSDGREEPVMSSHQPQRSSSAAQVAGFQDAEVNSVLDRLTRGSKHLQIVPICGMAGLGKTTFASNLYNCRSIIYHFRPRAWCTVSQVLDKKNVFLQLLNQLIPESGSYIMMTEDDLANKLRQCLKGKRYLIVLDDVWTTEAWQSLAPSFPDDSKESRIIFTSRHLDIVPNQQPYLLRPRTDNECLEILKMKLSHKEGWTSEIGMAFAKMCKGLPLTAVVVAGLLGTMKPQGWKGILDLLSSSGVSGEKQCSSALDLSFKHLPGDLKRCFLYFAAFPEDEEISVKRLLLLWIGEGFVRESDESKRIKDVAREYVEKLVQRSLVMVARNRSIGGVKTCRMHDLIRDFCLRRSKQENFFHILSQREDELTDFIEPPRLQRLSIHSEPLHFKEAMLFCPRAHSLLFFSPKVFFLFNLLDMVFIVEIFKLVTVLDIQAFHFNAGIPSEIELLTQLRYLSINCNSFIPSSLGNLPNLQTFIGEFFSLAAAVPFPHNFWNLRKLKWLYIKRSFHRPGFSFPTENLENSCALLELETLCGVVFNSYSSMEQQMRKFPNIRRLKCSILPGANSKKIVIPEFLNQLRCLTISGEGRLQCELGWNENLRRLSLNGFELSREEIADIGKLPNLEVLKLQGIRFQGDTLDMEEGEFSKLRYLKLVDMDIKSWTVSDEQLPRLNKLILHSCKVSEELPSDCLSYSATLEEIQVCKCSLKVEDFAREIQEAQEDYGNSVNLHITDSLPEATLL